MTPDEAKRLAVKLSRHITSLHYFGIVFGRGSVEDVERVTDTYVSWMTSEILAAVHESERAVRDA